MVSTRQQSNVGGAGSGGNGSSSGSISSAQAPGGSSSSSAQSSSSASNVCPSHHHQTSSGTTSDLSSSSSTNKSCRHHASSAASTSSSSSSSYHHNHHHHSHHQGEMAVQTVAAVTSPGGTTIVQLLDLPHEVLEKILSYIGYKNVSQLRLVCRHLDRVCSTVLNLTFQRLQTQMLHRFQAIKAKMPRRESARRTHPLACESDIIETLHMRLTLLQMSFGKHIERKHCCFFAGEILDEVYRILHYIRVTPKLARPYKVTDELFDLSTMAMEYFKEHIEPTLPEIAYFGSEFLDFSSSLPNSPPHGQSKSGDESPGHPNSTSSDAVLSTTEPCSTPQSNIMLRKRIRKIKQGMKRYSYQLGVMRRELRHCKGKLADQQKQIVEYGSRLDENDKKNEETGRKFSTVLQELNKCKTELQYWRSKSPSNSCPLVCVDCVVTGGVANAGVGVANVAGGGGVGGGVVANSNGSGGDEATLLQLHHAAAHAHHSLGHAHHSSTNDVAASASAGDLGFEAAASFPAALPGTSAEEVWNASAWGVASEQDNKTAAAAQPDETPAVAATTAATATVANATATAPVATTGNKRKASGELHRGGNSNKATGQGNASATAAKKPRTATVFKFRSKRL